MPSQSEYNGEPTLVPEGLRAYRHFTVESAIGYQNVWGDTWGNITYDCQFEHPYRLTPMSRNGSPYQPDTFGPHKATCKLRTIPVKFAHPDVMKAQPAHAAEETPKVSCKCGFYASYDPETDFYPDIAWGKDPTGKRSDGFAVRAVVELSGRIIMGTKGVRAEKMKIVAIAPDWSKFIWYSEPPSSDPPDAELREQVEKVTRRLARSYRLNAYGTPEEMHRALPKPDVEHLKPKPEGIDFGGYISGAAPTPAQAQSWRDFMAKLQQTTVTLTATFFDSIAPALAEAFGVPESLASGKMTVKEKALAMKKDPSRKGPAKSKGINYRR